MSIKLTLSSSDDDSGEDIFESEFETAQFNPDRAKKLEQESKSQVEIILSQPSQDSICGSGSDSGSDDNEKNEENEEYEENEENEENEGGDEAENNKKKFKGSQAKHLLWAKQPLYPNTWKARPPDRKADITRLQPKNLWHPALELTAVEKASNPQVPAELPVGSIVVEWLGDPHRCINVIPNTDNFRVPFDGPESEASKQARESHKRKKRGGTDYKNAERIIWERGVQEKVVKRFDIGRCILRYPNLL